jgi:ankyrin repeat protein
MEKIASPTSNSDCGNAAREKPGNVSVTVHMGKLRNLTHDRFQWAFLQIKQLLDLDRPGQIRERLGKLPEDLKQTYDEIYNGMKDHEKIIADRAFQWVMCAIEPLKTKVLLPAICQDENSDTLASLDGLDEDLALKYCHNLLVIDPVRKVWVPSHLSVIEYMENRWNLSQANCLVSSICLLVLQSTVLYSREKSWYRAKLSETPEKGPSEEEGTSKGALSSIGEEVQNTPTGSMSTRSIELNDPLHINKENFIYLSLYARYSWMLHAQRSAQAGNKQRVSTLLHEFLGHPSESSAAYRYWLRMVKVDYEGSEMTYRQKGFWRLRPENIAPDSVASFIYCLFDLAVILPDWHGFEWIKLDQRTILGESCLELAGIGKAFHTCRKLIQHSASVNDLTKSKYGSALASVAYRGNQEVVQFLVKEGGADVNMQLQLQCGYYGSALAAAAARAGRNRDVVEFLVKEGGADVNMRLQYGEYGSALAAAAFGKREVVEFLVKEGGADVNMQLQYGHYGSALAAAAMWGESEVVEFLVKEGGADVNMRLQYGNYGSALAAAAEGYKNKEVVEFLVKEGGADVNMQLQCGRYGSVLAAAARWGGSEVVEFLVKEGGADVNMLLQCGEYGSALAAAAFGKREVVEFLVKEGGADVNMQLQYGHYGSALAAAAMWGESEVVEFLVKEGGADVNMQLQCGNYGSALAAAARWRRSEVVEFLVKEGGADVNMLLQCGEYGSALAAAVAASIDDEDDDREDEWSNIGQIVEFLIKEGGAEVNMQLEHGKYANALDAAEKNGRSKIAQLLINLGATRQER